VVQSLRRSVAAWPDPPRILFISRADEEQSRTFFSQHWPQAEVISDPQGQWFRRYGVGRASWELLLDPRTWWAALTALIQGHRIGLPTRDPWQKSGYVLVERDQVLWKFLPAFAGQRPDWTSPPWLGSQGPTSANGGT